MARHRKVSAPPALTPREREVVAALVEGLTQKQIALRLAISTTRVQAIVAHVRHKSAGTTTAAMIASLTEGRQGRR